MGGAQFKLRGKKRVGWDSRWCLGGQVGGSIFCWRRDRSKRMCSAQWLLAPGLQARQKARVEVMSRQLALGGCSWLRAPGWRSSEGALASREAAWAGGALVSYLGNRRKIAFYLSFEVRSCSWLGELAIQRFRSCSPVSCKNYASCPYLIINPFFFQLTKLEWFCGLPPNPNWNRWKETYPVNITQKEVSEEKLTLDKVDLRAQIIIRNTRGCCPMIKEVIHWEALTILKVCV